MVRHGREHQMILTDEDFEKLHVNDGTLCYVNDEIYIEDISMVEQNIEHIITCMFLLKYNKRRKSDVVQQVRTALYELNYVNCTKLYQKLGN